MEHLPESQTTSIAKAACCPPKRRKKSCGRRRRKSKCGGGSKLRKFREGKKTRNAFLNFLRAYRKKCCGKNVKEIAKKGAKLWNCMSESQKAPYYRIACSVPKRKRGCRKRSRSRRKSRPCPKKRKRSCSRKRRKSSCRKKRRKSKTPCCPC